MAGKYNLMALWEFITFAAFPKFDVALDTYTVKESPPKHPKASHSIPFLLLLLPLSFFFFFFQKRPVKFDPIFLFSKEHTHLHTYTHWHTDTLTHRHTDTPWCASTKCRGPIKYPTPIDFPLGNAISAPLQFDVSMDRIWLIRNLQLLSK